MNSDCFLSPVGESGVAAAAVRRLIRLPARHHSLQGNGVVHAVRFLFRHLAEGIVKVLLEVLDIVWGIGIGIGIGVGSNM